MALQVQAVPPSCSLSSSALSRSSSSSSLHFLVSQSHSKGHATIKFRICCSNQTAQVDTLPVKVPLEASNNTENKIKKKKKKKSNLRPSFFDQIRDKWSHKLGSQRERLPWQEQQSAEEEEDEDEEEEEDDDDDDEGEEEECDQKNSASYSLDFQFPKRLSPWAQATNRKSSRFESESESDAKENGGIDGSVFKREEISVDNGEVRRGVEEKTFLLNNSVMGSVNVVDTSEGERKRRSNTALAERLIPEHELRRLRNVALRMVERFEVGVSGINGELVDSIHAKWRDSEVVKLKFEGPLGANMKRAHHTLESKTGGLVVWRSGSSIVLYRGMTYKLPCVEFYTKVNHVKENSAQVGSGGDGQVSEKEPIGETDSLTRVSSKYLKHMTEEELMELTELNQILDELGPRYKDWPGREPLPVDADLLPAMVPGYKTPFRLLPYRVKRSLSNEEMTHFRRLARITAPHFALGRNRELQGLANAMAKLWEKCAIAKIAIKRGVPHTRNERMAEELRRLTGGTLLSRNKEYIVFYRGNDFLPPAMTHVLTEREKLSILQQDEEEKARQSALPINGLKSKTSQVPLVAGTLAETRAASTNWGHEPTREEVQNMMRDSALRKLESFIRNLEKKLALAKARVRKAERALAKVQADLDPADLPTDIETLIDEERFLFWKIGLSMKPYLVLGRRDVFAGTIENMHLHWKYRELVKIIVKGRNLAQVKHIAISLEAESGGVLVSVEKDTKGYIIIVYRGKNYLRPQALRPKTLLSRRQALARSIELQRREALKHHIFDLTERIGLLKSELEDMKNGKKIDVDKNLYSPMDNHVFSDDDLEENEESQTNFNEDDSGEEDEKNQNKQLDLV
ncbi:hypothetical protein S245_038814 [Arachis hypogaea]|uniref:CRM domain-containing protein n=1 Tax=Arachis hypogaea TaxID=3818 RepID=A0A445AUT3_ARAHY|nr:Chloroplastic group IIA intron splicing facilitator CRS1 [Arachis hypogaea]RYR30146.1 hypothetical protein Ahy_B01g054974 [Arachis hypogaea]